MAEEEKKVAKKKSTSKKQEESNKYKKGTAKKGTVIDLSTFKPLDVQKWTKKKKSKKNNKRHISAAGQLSLGGSTLNGGKRLPRKKKNRSVRS